MDKKVYIQPQIEITRTVFTQVLAASGVTANIGDEEGSVGYGGVGSATDDPDVKGEAWTDIWE